MLAIETKNLTKKFKELIAVYNVDLRVEAGECFGLLGPNGAGKTTLIRMITGISPLSNGEIRVFGESMNQASHNLKKRIGVVPQLDNLDTDLSVLQNLITFSRYFDLPDKAAKKRSIEVLQLFELQNKHKSKVNELSGGMKRRLLIARGLLHDPDIMILDEPTVGLDPQAKYLVWDKLKELKENGKTLLLCTQNMEEARILCDRVAIMYQGKITVVDTPDKLISRYAGDQVIEISISFRDGNKVSSELRNRSIDFENTGRIIYIFHAQENGVEMVQEILQSAGNIKLRPATLEDVFFKISGRTLAE